MREYGLPGGRHPDYEIDHLIPLGIGGADSDANLWPEPRATIEPEWNAERKDQLEAKLRALVCAGRLDIAVAQKAVADDWTEGGGQITPSLKVKRNVVESMYSEQISELFAG